MGPSFQEIADKLYDAEVDGAALIAVPNEEILSEFEDMDIGTFLSSGKNLSLQWILLSFKKESLKDMFIFSKMTTIEVI